MKIFEVDSDEAAPRFFAGKTEASKHARECAAITGEPVNVVACTVIAGKAGVVALANGPGWQESSEVVYTAKPRRGSREALSADEIDDLM